MNGLRTQIGAIALLALAALGLCAASASGAPLSMAFTEARANVGVQLSDAALFQAPDTAPLEAQIGPAGESITAGDLQVPEFLTHITSPIDADVAVQFEIGVIDGAFTQPSGALTLSGTAGGTLRANGKECTVSTTPSSLTLSTAGNSGGASPRFGAPFSHGLTGAGAIAGQWTDMSAEPVDTGPGGDTFFCESVEEQIEGPGGIWLEQAGDVVPPPAPQLLSTEPASPSFNGSPRILGAAEAGSTVRLYAGPNCTGAPVATGGAGELASTGIPVEVAEGLTASFSATATDAANNTSTCSTSISYTRLHGDPTPPPTICIVPKLAGKTLARARAALMAADCKLGTVRRPKRPEGQRRRVLVVKSSSPGMGARPASGMVNLTLGSKPRRARST